MTTITLFSINRPNLPPPPQTKNLLSPV
ncbi:uncharacterized protein METZ01_LOCUS428585 [marine metagenome]|uniref:Uncharacterized protein n=1 Tax=marine metagenome TaxID=408172 RepID=A0A382XZ15_9ZZZZ